MTNAAALPSQRQEDWRYADIGALAKIWPLAPRENIIVPAGGNFTRTIAQDKGGVVQIDLSIGAGATAMLHILNIGGDYGRVEINAHLHNGADFTLDCAQIADGEQTLELITHVTHAEGEATSRQMVRNIAGGTANVTYLGRVSVARDAQGTNSAQNVKAMLLSPQATANAKPELEIFADDVQCAHGCAVGELDSAALFYLASRGLGPLAARQMLLQAFLAEALGGDAALIAAAHEKLGALQ